MASHPASVLAGRLLQPLVWRLLGLLLQGAGWCEQQGDQLQSQGQDTCAVVPLRPGHVRADERGVPVRQHAAATLLRRPRSRQMQKQVTSPMRGHTR